jgi:hypothetical protein
MPFSQRMKNSSTLLVSKKTCAPGHAAHIVVHGLKKPVLSSNELGQRMFSPSTRRGIQALARFSSTVPRTPAREPRCSLAQCGCPLISAGRRVSMIFSASETGWSAAQVNDSENSRRAVERDRGEQHILKLMETRGRRIRSVM